MRRFGCHVRSSLRPALVLAGALLLAPVAVPQAGAAVPPAPVLVSPKGSVPDPDPTYTWYASAGATEYLLQVFQGGTRLLQRFYDASAACVGGVCSRTPDRVLPVDSYTWKVQARNAEGGTWSPSKAFAVVAPAAPVPYAPSGPLTNPMPTYTWSSSTGATGYFLKVFDSEGAVLYQRSYDAANVCVETSCAATPGVELTMGDYSWTISASHASGASTSGHKAFDLGCEAQVALGDFNGDSRTDRLCSVSGVTYVSLSTGTGFINGAPWLGRFVDKPIAADFDGDGRTDVAGYDRATGAFSVALSTGTAFGPLTQWGVATVGGTTCYGSGPDVWAADFNGDGRTDVSCKKGGLTSVFVGLSTGTGFTFSIFGNAFCADIERTGTLDMDGDGKSDWYCLGRANDLMLVYPSTGSGFRAPVTAAGSSFCNDTTMSSGTGTGTGERTWAASSTARSASRPGTATSTRGSSGCSARTLTPGIGPTPSEPTWTGTAGRRWCAAGWAREVPDSRCASGRAPSSGRRRGGSRASAGTSCRAGTSTATASRTSCARRTRTWRYRARRSSAPTS